MTVAVTYGKDSIQQARERQTAEMVAGYLEQSTQTRQATVIPLSLNTRLNYQDYEKVVAIGGPQANPITARAETNHFLPELDQAGESYDRKITEDGAELLIIAGYNGGDTRDRAEMLQRDGTLRTFGGGQETDSPETPGIPTPPNPPEEEPATHRARLGYEPRLGGIGGLINFGSEDLADKFSQEMPPLAGWEVLRVEHDQEENIVDVYLLKKSSISAATVLLILAAIGSAVFVAASWRAVEMKNLQTQQTQLEDVDDAKEKLKQIANSDDVNEENRKAARETLIEILGKSGTPDEGDGAGGGKVLPSRGPLQAILGNLGTVETVALAGIVLLVLTDSEAPGPTIYAG